MEMINGLEDSVSVLENVEYSPSNHSDMLYNPEDIDFESMYREEGFTVSEYNFDAFEGVSLLSVCDVEISEFGNDVK